MYDKNGVACCTKKLDLAHSWLDAGWDEEYGGPFESWVVALEEKKAWSKLLKYKWFVHPESVYHVTAKKPPQKTRWNFECPTHHPVPQVAIILGKKKSKLSSFLKAHTFSC